ncbi:sugar-specific transcriptional regulator TrmB [Bacillus pakistanensis]|uniref:Sugar-specific transcriptional regulator TrmB n=1 Tax=Rossellomorea pakistanensis TaxID=992288 RepID=A0ABS2N794_9BACI|nr:TrmB family transcriptional regulator [Bacillus pakistanensis]MBM7583466.1 sugar-specific transcriptional regulator TrmB [Bacillus pakistanensis]
MLQQFGFTQYESQVYQSLITVDQPLDATGIVKSSTVPRSKVYEVLHRLIEKGMILETTVEKKRLYTALPIEATIKKLKTEFESNLEVLRNTQIKKTPSDDRVWTLKDNQSIQSMLNELIQLAQHSIYISGWADDLTTYLPLLESKYQAGIDVSIHVVGKLSTSIPAVSTLIPDSNAILERSRILIVDKQEILFAGIEDSKWQAIRTQSNPLVKFFTEFFYHDVALTEITQKYKDTIMEDGDIRNVLLKLRY